MNPVPTDSLRIALERLFQRTAHGIRPGLEIITQLLDALDHPERAYPYVHVAGTNGKGTVCAMVESVLRHTGYKTGLYTSPHLIRFNERIQVDGQPATDSDLAALIEAIDPITETVAAMPEGRPATFFEYATAMAFEQFKRSAVDWAVIETGMGGRWDATNVGSPAISVITRIDVDHVAYLGADIGKIAWEKAGIIKPGVPVVCGAFPDAVECVVQDAARTAGSVIIRADQSVRIQRMHQDWSGQKVKVETEQRSLRPFRLPLVGRHQVENCALAVAVLESLEAMGRIELPDAALRAGLAEVSWPARCQLLKRDPELILDVAHNPNGAAALAHTLAEVGNGQPVGLVIGFLDDKDAKSCMDALARVADRCWAVPIPHPRGMPPEEVRACAERAGITAQTASLAQALEEATAWAIAEHGMICIAGSLYLAGEVLKGRAWVGRRKRSEGGHKS